MECALHVALVVDNPYRDLTGLALVATRLAAVGAVCHLVPMDGQELELAALAPDAIVLNYLRRTNSELATQHSEAGASVFVLDTEGGVFSDVDRYGQLLCPDGDVRERVTGWLGWGPHLADEAVTRQWFKPNQVFVTGSPRFDFYVEPWRQAALSLVSTALTGPTVLVNTNFPVVNPRFQTPEQEAVTLVARYGFDPDHVARWQSSQSLTMHRLADATNRAARGNPDLSFVLRPHPFERMATYSELLEPLPNLVARKDGGVDGWILRSVAVVQRSCTTAIEAGLAGVVALSPTWIPVFEEVPVAEAVSIACPSEDLLDERLEAAASTTLTLPDSQRHALGSVVAKWFLSIDGRAHERVASVVIERSRAEGRSNRSRRLAEIGANEETSRRLRSMAKRSVPPSMWRLRPGRREAVWGRSEKAFSLGDVQRVVAAICRYGDRAELSVEPARADHVQPYRFGRSVTVRLSGPAGRRS